MCDCPASTTQPDLPSHWQYSTRCGVSETNRLGGVGQVVIVTFLLMIVLEQRRKRSIRQARELAFLSHHIWNAITQMTMASYLADPDKQQRIRCEAVERISGALRRVANSADLNGLSLEVDLTGVELTRAADKRAA